MLSETGISPRGLISGDSNVIKTILFTTSQCFERSQSTTKAPQNVGNSFTWPNFAAFCGWFTFWTWLSQSAHQSRSA